MDRFAQILYDLGKEIGVDLYPDQKRICQINYQEELHAQIQYDETKEQLLLATFVSDVPPGKYRELLFQETLKYNHLYPRVGTWAYSERNNKLTLFEYVPVAETNTEKLFLLLKAFLEKAMEWKKAIETGSALPTTTGSVIPPSHPFGLK